MTDTSQKIQSLKSDTKSIQSRIDDQLTEDKPNIFLIDLWEMMIMNIDRQIELLEAIHLEVERQ